MLYDRPRSFDSYDHELTREELEEELKWLEEEIQRLEEENDILRPKALGYSNLFSGLGISYVVFFIWEWFFGPDWASGVMGALALTLAFGCLYIGMKADPGE